MNVMKVTTFWGNDEEQEKKLGNKSIFNKLEVVLDGSS
jgi:hypothetical protein